MRYLFLIALLFLFPFRSMAGHYDSLKRVLAKQSQDSDKVKTLLADAKATLYINADTCLTTARMAWNIACKSGNKKEEAASELTMAMASLLRSNYKDAMTYASRAAVMHDSMKQAKQLGSDYIIMGHSLRYQKDFDKSMGYFKKAITIAARLRDTGSIVTASRCIDLLYIDMKVYDSAYKYAYNAYTICKIRKDSSREGFAMLDAGQSLYYLKKYDEGLLLCTGAIPFFKKDQLAESVSYQYMAKIYLAQNNIQLAKQYALKGKDLFANDGEKSNFVDLYELLYKVYKADNNPAEALGWLEKMTKVKDSLFSANNANQIAELDTKYQTAKKEKEIAALNEQKKLHNTQLTAILAFMFLLLVAIAIGWVNYRKISKLGTSLKEQKTQLETKSKALEDLNKVKDKLFSIISHDLRSPLAYMDSLLTLIGGKHLSEEKIQQYSAELSQNLQRTSQLLDNLLLWAASQMKGIEVNRKKVDVSAIIRENIEMAQSGAAEKKIAISETLQPDIAAFADISMTRLVVRNLLSNAIKYTPEGGNINIQSAIVGQFVRISVSDTGIGMDQALQDGLFVNPANESRPGTNAEKGFGLGLKLCKEFAEKNGGILEIESEPGKGSTFSFTLPVSGAI